MAKLEGVSTTSAGEGQPSTYRWVMALLMHAVLWVGPFFMLSLGVTLPLMREDLGFGPIGAGWLGTVGSLAPAIFSVPSAVVAVRFSAKAVMTAVAGLGAVLGAAQAVSPNFLVLIVARFLFSGIQTVSRPALDLLTLQWFPKNEMGRISSLGQAFGNLAMTIAIGTTPFVIAAAGGWRQAYLLFALLAVGLMALWIAFGRERPFPPSAQAASSTEENVSPMNTVRRYPFFVVGGLAFIGNAGPWLAMVIFWPTFLLEYRGQSLETAGVLTSMITMGGMTCSVYIGYVSDKVGLRKPFMWPLWLVAPLLYMSLLLPLPVPVLALLAFLVGTVCLAPVMALTTIPFELPGISPREVAVGRSVTSTMLTGGLGVLPVAIGLLWDSLGDLSWALGLSCLLPWAGLLLTPFIPETGSRRRAQGAYTARH